MSQEPRNYYRYTFVEFLLLRLNNAYKILGKKQVTMEQLVQEFNKGK